MEKTIENILPIIMLFVVGGAFFAWDILVQGEYVNRKIKKILCTLFILCFVVVFISITLIGRKSGLTRKVWIIPFYSYYKFLSGWQVYLFVQDIQNILLFVPLGFFGSLLLQQQKETRHKRLVIGSGLLLSLAVEVTQYAKAIGLLEVDDILHNTFGAFLGCLLYETIYCLRIEKTQQGRQLIGFNNRPQFIKNMKLIGIIIAMYLLVTLGAYANHLYHVHVLWK